MHIPVKVLFGFVLIISFVGMAGSCAWSYLSQRDHSISLGTDIAFGQLVAARYQINGTLTEVKDMVLSRYNFVRDFNLPRTQEFLTKPLLRFTMARLDTKTQIGGSCTYYINDINKDSWYICISKGEWPGAHVLAAWSNGTIASYYEIDNELNGINPQSTFDVPNFYSPLLGKPDKFAEWSPPLVWTATPNIPDIPPFKYPEMLYRMIQYHNGSLFVHYAWLNALEWSTMLKNSLQRATYLLAVSVDGWLLASSEGFEATSDGKVGCCLVAANQSRHNKVREIWSHIQGESGSVKLQVRIEGTDYFLQTLELSEIQLILVSLTPVDMILKNVFNMVAFNVSILALVFLTTLIMCGIPVVAMYTVLTKISDMLYAVSTLEVESLGYANLYSCFSEIYKIETSFNIVLETIRRCKQFLPDAIVENSNTFDYDKSTMKSGSMSVTDSSIMGRVASLRMASVVLPGTDPFRGVPTLNSSPRRSRMSDGAHSPIEMGVGRTLSTVFRARQSLVFDSGLKRKIVTCLWYNICSFHGVFQNNDLHQISSIFAQYVDAVKSTTTEQHGTVVSFCGDKFLCAWNANRPCGTHTANACLAAVSVTNWKDLCIEIRSGIATGQAMVGIVGSTSHKSFQVLGNVVNVASIMERTNKLYGSKILCTATTQRDAATRVISRLLGNAVTHETSSVAYYEVVGQAEYHLNEEWLYQVGQSNAEDEITIAVNMIYSGKAADAVIKLKQYIDRNPRDFVAGRLLTMATESTVLPKINLDSY